MRYIKNSKLIILLFSFGIITTLMYDDGICEHVYIENLIDGTRYSVTVRRKYDDGLAEIAYTDLVSSEGQSDFIDLNDLPRRRRVVAKQPGLISSMWNWYYTFAWKLDADWLAFKNAIKERYGKGEEEIIKRSLVRSYKTISIEIRRNGKLLTFPHSIHEQVFAKIRRAEYWEFGCDPSAKEIGYSIDWWFGADLLEECEYLVVSPYAIFIKDGNVIGVMGGDSRFDASISNIMMRLTNR